MIEHLNQAFMGVLFHEGLPDLKAANAFGSE